MMNLSEPQSFNLPLARRVLEFVEENPDRHNQASILSTDDCGTVGCIGGWVCHFAGVSWLKSGSRAAMEALGLQYDEMHDIFGEMDEEAAKEKLRHYIAQAEVAQSPIEELVLNDVEPVLVDA